MSGFEVALRRCQMNTVDCSMVKKWTFSAKNDRSKEDEKIFSVILFFPKIILCQLNLLLYGLGCSYSATYGCRNHYCQTAAFSTNKRLRKTHFYHFFPDALTGPERIL